MIDPLDLEIIEIFYQAIGDSTAWLFALGSLVKRFRADHGHLVADLKSPRGGPIFETTGLDATDVARFQSARTQELWAPFEKLLPVGRPALQAEVVSDRIFERSDFYNEVVKPTGGFYAMSYRERRTDDPLQLALCKARRDGEFETSDAQRLGRLLPHLTAAFNLHRKLRVVERKADGLAATLNRLEAGLILLRQSGAIDFINASALRLIEAPEIWLAHARAMEPINAKSLVRLQDVIREVAGGQEPARRRLYLRDSTGGVAGLVVDVELLTRFGFAIEGMPTACVAVFINKIGVPPMIDRGALVQLYGLTPREADIAAILAEGAVPELIAEKTGLTVGTVRFYLKQIYSKLGVSSQASLIATIQSCAMIRK